MRLSRQVSIKTRRSGKRLRDPKGILHVVVLYIPIDTITVNFLQNHAALAFLIRIALNGTEFIKQPRPSPAWWSVGLLI